MSKSFINKLNVYFNEPNHTCIGRKSDYKFLIFDEEKRNYFITNSYSIIRLNTNTTKDKEKIEEIKQLYGINESGIAKTITNIHNTQINNHFCIPFKNFSDIKDEEITTEDNKKFIKINNISFYYNKIKHIIDLIGGDGTIFTSENEAYFINISGKNGYAFLLGCKDY